ncbi:hypothetical protein OG394_29295 [Kribbella sp. NBC_01245]|uniref:hypothetical protein n=1 Tax=Kribbella sp. NBC_01245 TaxID=2903578 RepID=UPI002E295923|nr:hypothetical protein [Kribbella sp. NBC_01245]
MEALGTSFVPFVNALLDAEAAVAGLDGWQLSTTYRENIGDLGIDAGIRGARKTRHIPAGDSAWQFKAGDLLPAKCKAELLRPDLREPSAALETVRAGGTYRLVLGADLTPVKVTKRRKALEEAAASKGIEVVSGMFEVLPASALASWAEEHPSLAVSPLLGGIGNVAMPLAQWSRVGRLSNEWQASASRTRLPTYLETFVTGRRVPDLRLEGVSGIGKTRAVLEALRCQPFAHLVAYLPAYRSAPQGLLHHLQFQRRPTILVIDECEAREHDQLAGMLTVDSPVRLITIGHPTGYRGRSEPLVIDDLEEHAVAGVIKTAEPNLSAEHRDFAVAASAGNPRLAQIFADALSKNPNATVNDLISQDIIETYITADLPKDSNRLAYYVVALVPHVVFHGGSSNAFRELASVLPVTEIDLRMALDHLDGLGLVLGVSSTGQPDVRTCKITPHPLALHLARRAWEVLTTRILNDLLPAVANSDLLDDLVQRVAELGSSDVTSAAARHILGSAKLLEALRPNGSHEYGTLLSNLAAIAPEAVCDLVEAEVNASPEYELLDLLEQWEAAREALDRLAWNTSTFRRAADLIRRIARTAPIEDPSKPSPAIVGLADLDSHDPFIVRFTNLFGAILPNTAATPAARLRYLRAIQTSSDVRDRRLAVLAASRAIQPDETAFGSLHSQGTMLIESRGIPSTWGAAWDYKADAITILGALAKDVDPVTANSAVASLADAIQELLETNFLSMTLVPALLRLASTQLQPVRTVMAELRLLHRDSQNRSILKNLEYLETKLPGPTAEETVEYLADVNTSHDLDGDCFYPQLRAAVERINQSDRISLLLDILQRRPRASFWIGRMLGEVAGQDETVEAALTELARTGETPLIGYLHALNQSQSGAHDRFLDARVGATLDRGTRLRVTVRSPHTEEAAIRALKLSARLEPSDGARVLLGWKVRDEELVTLLSNWLTRLSTQADYNAVVDCVRQMLYGRPAWIEIVDPLVAELVAQCKRFPKLMLEAEDWSWLAMRQLNSQPQALANLLVELIEAGRFQVGALGRTGRKLLPACVAATQPQTWLRLMDGTAAENPRYVRAAARWLGEATDVETAKLWVGHDVIKARSLAAVTDLRTEFGPVCRFLITQFGQDVDVSSLMGGSLVAGRWIEEESDELEAELEVLVQRVNDSDPIELRQWVEATVEHLREQIARAKPVY